MSELGLLQFPKLLELVGLGYSSWFTYRYLLFKVCACIFCAWVTRPAGE